jgi:rubrerythrin
MIGNPDERMVRIFLNEAISAARNRMHAQRASAEGEVAMAAWLNAIAAAEEVRTERILMKVRGKAEPMEDHHAALLEAKQDALESDYPGLKAEFEKEGDQTTVKLLTKYEKAVENHVELLKKFQETKPDDAATYLICQVCGYIAVNEAPERCPACNAIRERFFKAD